MNSCAFIGRLGHDVSIRYKPDETAVGRFSLALDRGKDKDGKDRGTDWIECVAFGKTAETINRFFKKGNRIGVICHVNTWAKEDEDGNKKYYTDFIVDRFDFVEDKKPAKPSEEHQSMEAPAMEGYTSTDDIPF